MSEFRGRGGKRMATLAEEPRDFFMTLRDVAFWIRSARADATLARLGSTATPGEAFDQLYRSSGDPYASMSPQFRYQRRKYKALLSILPKRPYREVLDLGCGLGVLTRELAPHAEQVVGIDISSHAVSRARSLSTGLANVRYEEGDIQTCGRLGRFSLVVLADVIYYLSPLSDTSIDATATDLTTLLEPGGILLLVNHYFFGVDPASRMTRRIHNTFAREKTLAVLAERRRAFYLATVFERQ